MRNWTEKKLFPAYAEKWSNEHFGWLLRHSFTSKLWTRTINYTVVFLFFIVFLGNENIFLFYETRKSWKNVFLLNQLEFMWKQNYSIHTMQHLYLEKLISYCKAFLNVKKGQVWKYNLIKEIDLDICYSKTTLLSVDSEWCEIRALLVFFSLEAVQCTYTVCPFENLLLLYWKLIGSRLEADWK